MVLTVGVLVAALISAGAARAQSSCASGSSVYVVAHEDDSILFQNPDLSQDITGGRCVETVFATAGDAGQGSSYWLGREAGAKAAYAQIAGVPNTWTQGDAGVSGHPMLRFVLNANPNVSLVFMRLPDGNQTGTGFASTSNASIQKLWQGTITSIGAIDGSTSYTKTGLTSTLTTLIDSAGADRVATQDFVGSYGDGDHSDHHSIAYFTLAAGQADPTPHTLVGYIDYPITARPANLNASDSAAKQTTWFTYAPFDTAACKTVSSCTTSGYAAWWSRQYVAGSIQQPATNDPTVGSVSPAGGPQGTSAAVTVTGFAASHVLTVTVGGVPAQVTSGGTTNGTGTATVRFTIPAVAAGGQQVAVSDGTNSQSASNPFTVTPSVSGLTPTTGLVGSSATITASGFAASHVLTVTVGGVPAQVVSGGTADATGSATVGFSIPNVAPGSQAIVVSDGTNSAVGGARFLATAPRRPPAAGAEIVGVPRIRAGAASSALHVRVLGPHSTGAVTLLLRSSSRTGVLATSARGPWVRSLRLRIPTSVADSSSFFSRETIAGVATISATGNATVVGFRETVTPAAPVRLRVRPRYAATPLGRTVTITSVVLDRFGNVSRVNAAWTTSPAGVVGLSVLRGPVTTVRGLRIGHAVVAARWRRFHGSATVTVTRS
jgi:LmbE family N-acetylglucosaminyl deacetylase